MGIRIKTFRFVITLCVFTCALALSSCNIQGFFTEQGDPPVWHDPNPKGQDGTTPANPGQVLFNKNCASCHQSTGKGLPGSVPPLAGSAMATNDDATKSIRIVLHGFKGEIERNGTKYNSVMQSWKSNFDDAQIAQILSYVRSNWGNKASEVTADQVKDVREKTKTHAGAMTEADLEKPL